MVITSHTFYFLVETFTGVSFDLPQNIFCHLRVTHLNPERPPFRLIFFRDSSLYPRLPAAYNIFYTAQQHFFGLFRSYTDCSDINFYFSCNLGNDLFLTTSAPEMLDGALIQYMSFHCIIDQGWVSYVRVVPLDGLLNGVPVDWGWTEVQFHWFDQIKFQLVASDSDQYLKYVLSETPYALMQILSQIA